MSSASNDFGSVPVIDVAGLVGASGDPSEVARAMGRACREVGFFSVVGHGVDPALEARLEGLSRLFFALPVEEKMRIRMGLGGRAWRGYFPVGDELTSGKPDLKEGIYFGAELPEDHPLVRSSTPLHGRNLFPETPSELREVVLAYMDALTSLGHALMKGVALSLGLDGAYFAEGAMRDPMTLFRIFNYPADPNATAQETRWGVGEHTDYGVLTILKQDQVGGLQVKSRSGWVEAPPIPGSFVCNIGDMLDRMTAGLYRSTPHRVLNRAGVDRLSFPFFFDPGFLAEVHPIVSEATEDDHHERWDRASVHEFRGTYGEYLLGKVGKVFPDLHRKAL